ncbi:hypothetical protein [Thermocatellispora tengchongensis]
MRSSRRAISSRMVFRHVATSVLPEVTTAVPSSGIMPTTRHR